MALNIDKTYELVRLVVQKMEIKSEADDMDEAESEDPDVIRHLTNPIVSNITWSTPNVRHTLMKQASILAKWKSIDT